MWSEVLALQVGESILQHSSSLYQKEWNFAEPSPCVFHLTEPTCWKSVSSTDVHMRGRLLGGCIDVIRHLIGTPFGDVRHFQQNYGAYAEAELRAAEGSDSVKQTFKT
ncbi:hypothetical protein D3C75_936670 [compost metagenome]